MFQQRWVRVDNSYAISVLKNAVDIFLALRLRKIVEQTVIEPSLQSSIQQESVYMFHTSF